MGLNFPTPEPRPSHIVKPEIAATIPWSTTNTFEASLPLIVRSLAPGPTMAASLVICGSSPPLNVIVCGVDPKTLGSNRISLTPLVAFAPYAMASRG